MIEERRILYSVELLYASKTIQVKWLDQIMKDGNVIKETPHRCAYPADGLPDLPDPERPFAAEAIIRANVEQFAERLAAETETRQRLEADLAVAARAVQDCGALLEQTGALLKVRDEELANTRAIVEKRDQELKEARLEMLQGAMSCALLRERLAQLRDELAALKGR